MARRAAKGEPLNIAAASYNKMLDLVGESPGQNPGRNGYGTSPLGTGWVVVKNTTGSNRNRFDCMSIDAPELAITTQAREDLVFKLAAAAIDKPAAVLLEPIAAGKYGRAAIHGLTLATIAAASSAAMLYGFPNASGNNLSASWAGPVKLLAAPSTAAASLVPVMLNAAYTPGVHFYSSSSITAFNSTTKQMGSGTVRRWLSNGTGLLADSGQDITVYNPAGTFTGARFGFAYPNEAGRLVIVVEQCN